MPRSKVRSFADFLKRTSSFDELRFRKVVKRQAAQIRMHRKCAEQHTLGRCAVETPACRKRAGVQRLPSPSTLEGR
eukprot:4803459-Alexandrium_andersonii.AAC.1